MQNRGWTVVMLACFSGIAFAQEAEKPKQRPRNNGAVLREQIDAHKAGLDARSAKIDGELAALDREALPEDHWARQWAGTYYTGDGLGTNVIIKVAPESGVTYTWHGCLGLYDMNHGDIVEELNDGLRLKLAFDPDLDYTDFMDERLYFVRWGERKYLVPDRQMLQLVNNYNQGGYARSSLYNIPSWYEGRVSRRWGTVAPEGVPQLPPKWAAMLLREPLELTITAVEAASSRPVTDGVCMLQWKLEFSGGRADGVYEGMELWIREGLERGTVKITEVEEDRCRGELVYFTSGEEMGGPEVGQTVVLPEE